MRRIALVLLAALLVPAAAQAQSGGDTEWHELAATGCYQIAKKRVEGASWFRHERIYVLVTGETSAFASVWFPGGDRNDWIAICKVERSLEEQVSYYTPIKIEPYVGAIPVDRGISVRSFDWGKLETEATAPPPQPPAQATQAAPKPTVTQRTIIDKKGRSWLYMNGKFYGPDGGNQECVLLKSGKMKCKPLS